MFGDFLGFGDIEAALYAAVTITDGNGAPLDAAAAPTFRVYDGQACIATGTLTKLDTAAVTGLSNASPIVATSVAHGLQTGNKVNLAGATGNTAANGNWVVTRTGADTFSLNGSAGNGPWISGGIWHVLGLYQLNLALLSSNGFKSGGSYQVLVNWNDGGSDRVKELTLGVL